MCIKKFNIAHTLIHFLVLFIPTITKLASNVAEKQGRHENRDEQLLKEQKSKKKQHNLLITLLHSTFSL